MSYKKNKYKIIKNAIPLDVANFVCDYFRLKKSQLIECQLIMKSKGGDEYFEPIFKGRILFLTFILAWVTFSGLIIKLGIDPLLSKFF